MNGIYVRRRAKVCVKDRKVIWADLALRKHPSLNNVKNNLSGLSLMTRAVTGLVKPDLHMLFGLHVQGRGTAVGDPDGADTLFAVHRGITPFDVGRIAAEFL